MNKNNCRCRTSVCTLVTLFLMPVPAGAEEYPYQRPELTADERVENLISLMSLDEKLKMLATPVTPKSIIALANGLTLPFETSRNERLGIPPFVTGGGSRGAIEGSTAFPVAMARGASWDPELEYRVFDAIGAEAAGHGMNLLLAPVLTVVRHPGFGRAQETYGEDTFLLGEMGVNAIQGIQNHVMAQVKHYALNSIEENRYHINVNVDERTLREIYTPHFRKAVQDAQVVSVMTSYNRVNGLYASENAHLITDILRNDWGFSGFVMSDWLDGVRSTAAAINAGLDIEMPLAIHFTEPKLMASLNDGEITENQIDEILRRTIKPKFEWGLFDNPQPADPSVIRSEKHRELALEAARQSMTLLKNENDVLPLKRSETRNLVVLGRFANVVRLGDNGSSIVTDDGEDAVTPFHGIVKAAGSEVAVSNFRGFLSPGAIQAVADADAIVMVAALSPYDEGEWIWQLQFLKPGLGGDRRHLSLGWEDRLTIRLASWFRKPLIVVLEGGSAIIVDDWIENVDSVLMAWYPGVKGGLAIGETLFGDNNPSGKTPLSWPKKEEDLYTFGSGLKDISYGYFQGYRYYDKFGIEPRFPFGFGLSYTSFSYDAMRVEVQGSGQSAVINVHVSISNTGNSAGKETVQLYVGYENSQVERAPKDLRGFRKVALNPGETRDVLIQVPVKELLYWDVESARWQLEDIPYWIHVGKSSREIELSEMLQLDQSVMSEFY